MLVSSRILSLPKAGDYQENNRNYCYSTGYPEPEPELMLDITSTSNCSSYSRSCVTVSVVTDGVVTVMVLAGSTLLKSL